MIRIEDKNNDLDKNVIEMKVNTSDRKGENIINKIENEKFENKANNLFVKTLELDHLNNFSYNENNNDVVNKGTNIDVVNSFKLTDTNNLNNLLGTVNDKFNYQNEGHFLNKKIKNHNKSKSNIVNLEW